jgi:hypothetical protein
MADIGQFPGGNLSDWYRCKLLAFADIIIYAKRNIFPNQFIWRCVGSKITVSRLSRSDRCGSFPRCQSVWMLQYVRSFSDHIEWSIQPPETAAVLASPRLKFPDVIHHLITRFGQSTVTFVVKCPAFESTRKIAVTAMRYRAPVVSSSFKSIIQAYPRSVLATSRRPTL